MVLGRIKGAMETTETIEATKLWERAGPRKKTPLLEAGGPGAGAVRAARPHARENWLKSTQWTVARQLRLFIWNVDGGLRCRHTNRQEEVHALDCKHSPARIKIHNSVCKALREQLRRLRADVDDECMVPELSRWWLETVPLEPLGRMGKEVPLAIEAIAADAAMIRGDWTGAPNVARRIRRAVEYTLIAGVADVVGEAAGGSGMQTWERGANPRVGRLHPPSTKMAPRGAARWRHGCGTHNAHCFGRH